jgi:PTS system cellobiose-specific IIC component
MGLVATFGVAYRLSESYKLDALAGAAISLAAYFVVSPFTSYVIGQDPNTGADILENAYNTGLFTSKGLFVGMVIAILSTEIYRKITQMNIVIKLPDGVPPAVSRSFSALIPAFVAVVVAWGLRLLVENIGDFGSIHNVVSVLLQQPLTSLGTSLVGTIIVFILIQMLWCLGLHGANIVNAVILPVWLTLTQENAMSFEAGEPVKNIVTNEFNDIVFIGGSGTTLSLVLAMVFFARSQQMKQLGRLGIGPGIFNINEPVTFGMPIVLNPIMMIPFILAPVAAVIMTFVSMDLGLVAKPIGVVTPFTMPPILNGYIITGSISGAILQLAIIVVSFFIYFPFFKMWDAQKLNEEKGAIKNTPNTENTVNM